MFLKKKTFNGIIKKYAIPPTSEEIWARKPTRGPLMSEIAESVRLLVPTLDPFPVRHQPRTLTPKLPLNILDFWTIEITEF